ncbi:hypothetical protein [Brunnivagina elsteri]|uniref:Uncharacterized protein n=1 Tax=Brunnivagina elsteri CCALA 953 TaxID=987040 RepID=A0A2A2TNF0_9CYAN|nr:hypothetical protein [Calothrix elsteri]PAX59962.1 hypothetical protein CK510_04260 [Calothrix elsteri CCALA 953]
MTDTTTTEPTKLEFIQYHQPALKDGDYEITVEQKITDILQIQEKKIQEKKIQEKNTFTITRTFSVSGERFELKPTDIHAVFPPNGSLGEHSHVLPHIILNRSTLPWERIPFKSQVDTNNNLPWLALLLFEEEEKPEPKIITLGELKNPQLNAGKFPKIVDKNEKPPTNESYLQLESGQNENNKLTIIDVQKQLLEKILPTKDDLEYLAHVRQGTDDAGKLVGDELAIIIGNRLPEKGSISTVHLVSIEGRYNTHNFNFQEAKDDDYIRFVSLQSWSFACVDEKQSFKGLLAHLNREPSILRLPKTDNPEAEQYLSMGYIPLPHFLRQGSKTFSWYHSPLIPGQHSTDTITLPIRAADELVCYNPDNGMFDISYAAAWELGRLLGLQGKSFSISLYNWKRSHKQSIKCVESAIDSHLPFHNISNIELPSEISSWFENLSLLKGIPFNYLVPDEQMLPVESIRFFWVDPSWIECLLDGAFSIGRVTTSDHTDDINHNKNNTSPAVNPHEMVTGFLLRSDVVAGWPGLLVDGYSKVVDNEHPIPNEDKLELLRMDRLSANVLICLFKGEVKTVDIHQKPETLHFGLDSDDEGKTFYKKLKTPEGKPIEKKVDKIPWKYQEKQEKRVININELANLIKAQVDKSSTFTSAQFALEMIEGVEKVRFNITH